MDFAQRAARNEEIFRSVNERIDQSARQQDVDSPLPFHCECDRAGCFDKIDLQRSDYERIIAHRYRFVLIPGHEDPRVELVVERNDDYLVAEKIGEARERIDRDHPQQQHHD